MGSRLVNHGSVNHTVVALTNHIEDTSACSVKNDHMLHQFFFTAVFETDTELLLFFVLFGVFINVEEV